VIYVDEMDFIPGSQYMPFSSHLDFLGQPIPYWMYVSGNNLLREQVPSKNDMEAELARYVKERIDYCDYSDFELQGYSVLVKDGDGDVNVEVNINNLDVEVIVKNQMGIGFEGDSVIVTEHEVSVGSKLGKFYDLAKEVYDYEKQEMFLEKYAVDVMRVYVPVSGAEISCSPKIFIEEEIRSDLIDGLVANVGALKLGGNYYDLSSKENKYFVTDIGSNVDENVNFVYSPDWPTRVEIFGDRVVEPIGLQEGLGILGFCYVPYNLVYDINFPVLIQFFDNNEIFQFPIAVVVSKNQAREALPTEAGTVVESEVCKYKNKEVSVYTYDLDLNPVEARVRFKCLNDECEIGNTELGGGDAVLNAPMPMCVNGFVVASAEGYVTGKYQISTNEDSVANVLMKKLYTLDVEPVVGNAGGSVLVSFVSEDHSTTILYPEMDEVELSEGYYNVSVYVYRNSTLIFPASSQRKCVNVPAEGIGGVFGAEREECFDINLPETEVSMAVVGGGKTMEYLIRDDLESSSKIKINIPMFKTPGNLDELQENYIEVEDSIVEVILE